VIPGFKEAYWYKRKTFLRICIRDRSQGTTIAIRDNANEINETVKGLKERGTIKDTVSAVGLVKRSKIRYYEDRSTGSHSSICFPC
jgi:hypothetical protein